MAMLHNQRVDLIDMKPSTKQVSVRIWLCCYASKVEGAVPKNMSQHLPSNGSAFIIIYHNSLHYDAYNHNIYPVYIYIYTFQIIWISSLNSLNILKHSDLPTQVRFLQMPSALVRSRWSPKASRTCEPTAQRSRSACRLPWKGVWICLDPKKSYKISQLMDVS